MENFILCKNECLHLIAELSFISFVGFVYSFNLSAFDEILIVPLQISISELEKESSCRLRDHRIFSPIFSFKSHSTLFFVMLHFKRMQNRVLIAVLKAKNIIANFFTLFFRSTLMTYGRLVDILKMFKVPLCFTMSLLRLEIYNSSVVVTKIFISLLISTLFNSAKILLSKN